MITILGEHKNDRLFKTYVWGGLFNFNFLKRDYSIRKGVNNDELTI